MKKPVFLIVICCLLVTLGIQAQPLITSSNTPLSFYNVYGTASASQRFTVSGTNMLAGILVTAPAGSEVSSNNITFSPTVTIGNAGTITNTNVYVRTAQTTNAGNYTGMVSLSSPSATATVGPAITARVDPYPISLWVWADKTYGATFASGTYDYTQMDGSIWNAQLKNGNKFNSIDVTFGAGAGPLGKPGVYIGAVTIKNFTGRDGYLPGNYIVTYMADNLTVIQADLTITAKDVSNPFGATLTNVIGSTAFTASGLQNGETITTVDINYGAGAAAVDAVGTYNTSVMPVSARGGTSDPANYNLIYIPGKLIVTAAPTPEIIPSTVVASGLIRACAGTASVSPYVQSFQVSGKDLTGSITATASADFEVALTVNGSYGNSVTIPQTGGIATNVSVYIRSAATAAVGNISGVITLSSPSAPQKAVGVNGVINSAATVDKLSPLTLLNGQGSPGIALTGSGNVFTWTNDNPAIGLPASGKGTIPFFKAVNTGTTPVSATVTITPKSLPLLKVVTASTSLFTTINTLNDQEVGRFTSKWNGISSITIRPNGKQIYAVQDVQFGNILGYQVASDTLYSAITAGSGSNKVVISPDGTRAFVTMKGDAFNHETVVVLNINAAPYSRDGYINLNVSPVTEAISADGKRLYVVSKQPDVVTLVNTGNYTDFKTIITSGLVAAANSAIVSPDDSKLFVAGVGVSVIDQATNTIIRNFATNITIGDIAISPDGKTFYMSEPSANRVLKFDVNTGVQLAAITVGQNPKAIALTGDGTQLFVANSGETSVSVVNTATFTLNRNIATPSAPSFIALIDGTACPGIPEQYKITVNPTPTLYKHSAPSALDTEYGTQSAVSTFSISGTGLTAEVRLTAPAGFELSTDGKTFSDVLHIPASGTLSQQTITIRLKLADDAADYQGDIAIGSLGAIDLNVPMPLSKVRPALLTLRATDYPKTYGQAISSPSFGSNAYTIVAGGLKNNNTISSVTITYRTGSAATDDVGTYAQSIEILDMIGANGFVRSNYLLTGLQKGNIIVNKAVLSIKADNVTKPYGTTLTNGANTTGFTVTGLQNQQTIGSVVFTYTDGATANAAMKDYPAAVTIAGAAGGTFKTTNYTISTYTPGDLKVTPATITVTVNNVTKDRGRDNPAFTATYTGFINTDNQSVIKTLPKFSTTATRKSPAGTYPITASGAAADSYIFVYVAGTLTVVTPPVIALKIPNTITPNGDGINDVWEIGNIYAYPNCTVNIFTRYGQPVFASNGYNTSWNGTYKGQMLNTGTYYYVIKLDNVEKPVSGSITLLR